MLKNTMHVIVEAEPYLAKAWAHVREAEAAEAAWSDFMEDTGARAVAPAFNGLLFDGDVPDGWTKREGRGGFSRPKAGTDDADVMTELPKPPKAWDVFGDTLVYEIGYEENGGRKCRPVCELWDGPIIVRAGSVLFAQIPDPVAAAAEVVGENPRRKLAKDALEWMPPEGLRRVEEKEVEAAFAA